MPSSWGIKALAAPAPRTRRGRPGQSASKPQAASPTSVIKTSWGRREYHDETHFVTTIIVAGVSIAVKQARRTQPWSQVTLSTGNTRKIWQIHAPDLIRRERRDQQKNKTRSTTTKITSKNCTNNVHHHDDRWHSSKDESRDDPGERKQEQRLLVRR